MVENVHSTRIKVSHSYRIRNVFAQPEVASEVRRTSHFVTSDVVNYPLRYLTIHNSRLSEQVRSMSDLSLLQLPVPMKTKVEIALWPRHKNRPKTDRRLWNHWMHESFWDSLASAEFKTNISAIHQHILDVNPCGLGPLLSIECDCEQRR